MALALNGPGLANLMQVAWVTPDLDRSMAQFAERYRVPDFFVTDVSYPARFFDESGVMQLRLALANIDNMQIELIQPVSGGVDRIYREVLPTDGAHANVFHHLCVRVDGSLEDWDAYIAALGPDKKIAHTGDPGPGVRFIYTDERDTLRIYLEHVWYEPAYYAQLSAMIPSYRST